MGRHVAFKCTYNDGGEGKLVGFCDMCSLDNIKRNIESGRVWCSQPECPCWRYRERGFSGSPPVALCYESTLFRDWRFGAGTYHHGPKKGQPKWIRDLDVGCVAILTTRFPQDEETDRKIIGLFRVGEVRSEPETVVIADEECRVRLPLEEAKELYFWDYYQNPNSPDNITWGVHLFRYLTNAQVARIITDVKETVRDECIRNGLESMLREVWGFDTPPPASGPRLKQKERQKEVVLSRTQRVIAARKYGPTGEGLEHRRLKEWLADRPGLLGYGDVVEVTQERVFRSGDCADIVWRRKDGRCVVVEVETYTPEPGAYQALKYRCLLCAEMGLDLNSPDVEAWVVAREIPESVRILCKRYEVNLEQFTAETRDMCLPNRSE